MHFRFSGLKTEDSVARDTRKKFCMKLGGIHYCTVLYLTVLGYGDKIL